MLAPANGEGRPAPAGSARFTGPLVVVPKQRYRVHGKQQGTAKSRTPSASAGSSKPRTSAHTPTARADSRATSSTSLAGLPVVERPPP